MFVQDTLNTIDEAWKGSFLVLGDVSASGSVDAPAYTFMSICVIILLFLFLIFFKRVVIAVQSSFLVLVKRKDYIAVFDDKYSLSSIIITFSIAVPTLAFVLYNNEMSGTGYFNTLLLLAGYFVVKHILYMITGWMSNQKETFLILEKTGFCAFIVITTLSMVTLPVSYFFSGIHHNFDNIFVAGVSAIIILMYFVKGYKIFISSIFSHFFWFLYLCTLELLPLCLLIDLIL